MSFSRDSGLSVSGSSQSERQVALRVDTWSLFRRAQQLRPVMFYLREHH